MFLLNNVESNFNDKTIEKIEKRDYEQSVSGCKKWCSFIKTFVGRNITVL